MTEQDADLEQIVLVGAPGAGKSTVGAVLAERLGCDFRDVDAVIVERVGKPIAEMFVDDGEPAFRAYEEAITAELLDRARCAGPGRWRGPLGEDPVRPARDAG